MRWASTIVALGALAAVSRPDAAIACSNPSRGYNVLIGAEPAAPPAGLTVLRVRVTQIDPRYEAWAEAILVEDGPGGLSSGTVVRIEPVGGVEAPACRFWGDLRGPGYVIGELGSVTEGLFVIRARLYRIVPATALDGIRTGADRPGYQPPKAAQ